MSAYALHLSGDCWDTCPVCANQCDTCGAWITHCPGHDEEGDQT